MNERYARMGSRAMIGENPPLVTYELVEFEKEPVEVQKFKINTD